MIVFHAVLLHWNMAFRLSNIGIAANTFLVVLLFYIWKLMYLLIFAWKIIIFLYFGLFTRISLFYIYGKFFYSIRFVSFVQSSFRLPTIALNFSGFLQRSYKIICFFYPISLNLESRYTKWLYQYLQVHIFKNKTNVYKIQITSHLLMHGRSMCISLNKYKKLGIP